MIESRLSFTNDQVLKNERTENQSLKVVPCTLQTIKSMYLNNMRSKLLLPRASPFICKTRQDTRVGPLLQVHTWFPPSHTGTGTSKLTGPIVPLTSEPGTTPDTGGVPGTLASLLDVRLSSCVYGDGGGVTIACYRITPFNLFFYFKGRSQ